MDDMNPGVDAAEGLLVQLHRQLDDLVAIEQRLVSEEASAKGHSAQAASRALQLSADLRAIRSSSGVRRLLRSGNLDRRANVVELDLRVAQQELEAADHSHFAIGERLEQVQVQIFDVTASIRNLEQAQVPPTGGGVLAGLRRQPPAASVAPADQPAITRDMEGLLTEAERYAADESNPPELRDSVSTRRRSLLGELQLYGVQPDSEIIVRSAAYLIHVLEGSLAPSEDSAVQVVDEAIKQISAVAENLADDGMAAEAGTTIASELDHVDAVKASGEATDDSVGAAVSRGRNRWLEGDLWDIHVNRIVTAGANAAGVALGYGADTVTGGHVRQAILRAAIALLRSRFPFIFPAG